MEKQQGHILWRTSLMFSSSFQTARNCLRTPAGGRSSLSAHLTLFKKKTSSCSGESGKARSDSKTWRNETKVLRGETAHSQVHYSQDSILTTHCEILVDQNAVCDVCQSPGMYLTISTAFFWVQIKLLKKKKKGKSINITIDYNSGCGAPPLGHNVLGYAGVVSGIW